MHKTGSYFSIKSQGNKWKESTSHAKIWKKNISYSRSIRYKDLKPRKACAVTAQQEDKDRTFQRNRQELDHAGKVITAHIKNQ